MCLQNKLEQCWGRAHRNSNQNYINYKNSNNDGKIKTERKQKASYFRKQPRHALPGFRIKFSHGTICYRSALQRDIHPTHEAMPLYPRWQYPPWQRVKKFLLMQQNQALLHHWTPVKFCGIIWDETRHSHRPLPCQCPNTVIFSVTSYEQRLTANTKAKHFR